MNDHGLAGVAGLVGRAAGAVVVALLLVAGGYGAWRFTLVAVPTDSMTPTVNPGDRLVVDEHAGPVRVGDVVVVDAPQWESGTTTLVVKRVVAVGGQTVTCCDAALRVSVDGVPLAGAGGAPALRTTDGKQQGGPFSIVVPPGRLFLMGDNRAASVDSRAHLDTDSGTLPVSAVVGVVTARAWPPGSLPATR